MGKLLFDINGIPAVMYGDKAEKAWLFVHGKSGCKEEGEAFAKIACPRGFQVVAVDLPEHGERRGGTGFDPWHAVPELSSVTGYMLGRWGEVSLRANSIGAWFSMLAMKDLPISRALMVSPILDMEKLIQNMMVWAGVSRERLEREGEIPTDFGETLSIEYLRYVLDNRIENWGIPTAILYAGGDNMTDRGTAEEFSQRFGCHLTVMENGEHWFHTPEQLYVLEKWEKENIEP